MRHVRLKQDILTKTTKLVRGGLMPEEPWLQVLRVCALRNSSRDNFTCAAESGMPAVVLYFSRVACILNCSE